MNVSIYYRQWEDSEIGSHELLAQAVRAFLASDGRSDRSFPETFHVVRDSQFGKPYIKELQDVHFSISHSGIWWCCAIAEAPVGLDIQENRTRNQEKLARRFFHPAEVCWMETHGFEQFCKLWTYKESYVKFTGKGLTEGMDYFSVVPEHFESGEQDEALSFGAPGCVQQEVLFQKNYPMVCTTKEPAQIMLHQLL